METTNDDLDVHFRVDKNKMKQDANTVQENTKTLLGNEKSDSSLPQSLSASNLGDIHDLDNFFYDDLLLDELRRLVRIWRIRLSISCCVDLSGTDQGGAKCNAARIMPISVHSIVDVD